VGFPGVLIRAHCLLSCLWEQGRRVWLALPHSPPQIFAGLRVSPGRASRGSPQPGCPAWQVRLGGTRTLRRGGRSSSLRIIREAAEGASASRPSNRPGPSTPPWGRPPAPGLGGTLCRCSPRSSRLAVLLAGHLTMLPWSICEDATAHGVKTLPEAGVSSTRCAPAEPSISP